MTTWINFKELRARLDFEKILRHYGVEVKRKGSQHHGFCPLPNHNGKKNSPSFSANLEKGIFQCFGCGAKGNALEFAAMMEKVNVEDGAAFRTVAIELQKRLCPEIENTPNPKAAQTPPKAEALIPDCRRKLSSLSRPRVSGNPLNPPKSVCPFGTIRSRQGSG